MNKAFKNRIILINMTDFDKLNFDAIKKRINKKINKEFHVPQWGSYTECYKMMRINLISTDFINEPLYTYLSSNAEELLRRSEGVINLAIVKNRLIVPPLFGDVDDIDRYKKTIQMLKSLLR